MQHYSSQAFTDIGKPAGGASITVKLAGSNTNAAIYSDDGVTVKSNPFVTNNLGQFDFYAASGKYDITVTGTQITTYTLSNQVVFDPFEVSSGDQNGLTPINTSGLGGFWGLFPDGAPSTLSGQVFALAANQVYVFAFVLPRVVNVNRVSVTVTGAVAGATDVGIYSASGNRLVYTNGGINMNVTGVQTATVIGGPIMLLPGFYYFAETTSVASAAMAAWAIITPAYAGPINANGNRIGTAANASSNGILPPTLGVISPTTGMTPVTAFFER